MTERELLARTAELAADYLETLDTRSVGAARDYRGMLAALDRPLPEDSTRSRSSSSSSAMPGTVSWRWARGGTSAS